MSRPDARTFIRDTIIFSTGLGITVGQTGFPYLVPAPAGGPNVWALLVGALFCNGPVMLQALALRFGGTSTSGQVPELPAPLPPSAPSSAPSSGGE